MAKVNLSDIKEGMITAEPVRIQNKVILGEGITITEKHIHLFKTWGVAFVEIDDDNYEEEEAVSSLTPEEKAAILEDITKRFSLVKEPSPVMQEIKRITEKLILS